MCRCCVPRRCWCRFVWKKFGVMFIEGVDVVYVEGVSEGYVEI